VYHLGEARSEDRAVNMGHRCEGECRREADQRSINPGALRFHQLDQRTCNEKRFALDFTCIGSPVQDFSGTPQAKLCLIECREGIPPSGSSDSECCIARRGWHSFAWHLKRGLGHWEGRPQRPTGQQRGRWRCDRSRLRELRERRCYMRS
jgi:hypothetical protein